jgi:sec-independent protein translocase protein TatC
MRRDLDEQDEFKEMELWEHLDELRQRLIRAALYIAFGLAVAWMLYPVITMLFFDPIKPYLQATGGRIVFRHFMDGFMLQLKVSLVAGLVVAIPLVTFELWGFIAPGLTRNERRACKVVFPLSIFFFFAGVVCGYLMMSVALGYFVQFIPKDVELLQDPIEYIMFLVKMVVAFGVCFQMPVVLMFLAWVGLVGSDALKKGWRIAVVACFIVGAIATPGGDPMTMMVMAAPLAVLYIASIYLCALVEKLRHRQDLKELAQAG